jgi:hypothetical protein
MSFFTLGFRKEMAKNKCPSSFVSWLHKWRGRERARKKIKKLIALQV